MLVGQLITFSCPWNRSRVWIIQFLPQDKSKNNLGVSTSRNPRTPDPGRQWAPTSSLTNHFLTETKTLPNLLIPSWQPSHFYPCPPLRTLPKPLQALHQPKDKRHKSQLCHYRRPIPLQRRSLHYLFPNPPTPNRQPGSSRRVPTRDQLDNSHKWPTHALESVCMTRCLPIQRSQWKTCSRATRQVRIVSLVSQMHASRCFSRLILEITQQNCPAQKCQVLTNRQARSSKAMHYSKTRSKDDLRVEFTLCVGSHCWKADCIDAHSELGMACLRQGLICSKPFLTHTAVLFTHQVSFVIAVFSRLTITHRSLSKMQPRRFPALEAVDELHVELIAAVNVREADRAASAVDHAADHAGAAELSPEASQGQEPAHSPAFLPLQLAPIGEASDEDVQSVGTTASMAHVATATVAQLTLSYLAPPSDEGGSSRAQQQELPVSGATPDDMPDGDQLMDRPPESKGASMSAARHHVLAAAHALDIENGYDPMEAAIISRRQRRRSTHELSPTQPFTRGHEPLRAEDPAVQPPLPRADAPFSLPGLSSEMK